MNVKWGRSTRDEPVHAYRDDNGMSLCELSSVPEGFESFIPRPKPSGCCATCFATRVKGDKKEPYDAATAEAVMEDGREALHALATRLMAEESKKKGGSPAGMMELIKMMMGATK